MKVQILSTKISPQVSRPPNNCLFMYQHERNTKLAATFPGLVYTKKSITTTQEVQEKTLRYPSLPNLCL